jgi:hypothetical protein
MKTDCTDDVCTRKTKVELPDYLKKEMEENERRHAELLANIRAKMPELDELLKKAHSHWGYEDHIYRFYHHSFKVYLLQKSTMEIAEMLYSLAPEWSTINADFLEIMSEGAADKQFEHGHNAEWTKHTRPFVEAFFHARFFLEMAVKYGSELDHPPQRLPSGWAALLYLYNLR